MLRTPRRATRRALCASAFALGTLILVGPAATPASAQQYPPVGNGEPPPADVKPIVREGIDVPPPADLPVTGSSATMTALKAGLALSAVGGAMTAAARRRSNRAPLVGA